MSVPLPNGPNGRNAKGQFTPGNPGGPGNPFAAKVMSYRRAFHAAVTDEDVQALARRLYELALAGDMAAAKLVLQYTMGQGHETTEVETDAGNIIRIIKHYDDDPAT